MKQNSGVKTEIMNKQSMISNYINKKLLDKTLASLSSCGENCVNFNYEDGTSDRFEMNYNDNILIFGDFKTNLPENTFFQKVSFDTIHGNKIGSGDNALLQIIIPISNSNIKDEKFDVKIIYPYDDRIYETNLQI